MRIESELPHGHRAGRKHKYPYDEIAAVVADGKWAVLDAADYEAKTNTIRLTIKSYSNRRGLSWRVHMVGDEIWIGPADA